MTAFIETLRKSQVHAPSKPLNIALWVAQIGGAGMFLMSSFGKLNANPQMVGLFNALGGQWFRYFTGLTELIGAVLLLIPALSGVGGLLLSAVMVGALITHAIIGGSPVAAIVMLAAMSFVAWGRRDRTLRLLQRVL